jgi:FAD/FMN-containing dehydrogenase
MVLAGGLGAAAVLAACTSRHPAAKPAPSASAPDATTTPQHVSADWASVPGSAIRPGGSGYATASRLYNPRYDATSHPQAISACHSAAEVANAIRWAAGAGVPFAIRTGGHSYTAASTSTGLVIDVSGMSQVIVDTANQQARIQAGAHLATVYSALAARHVGIPAGSCATVGMAGLTLGGGIGVLSRGWGLTCDAVTEVDIVTADGTLRTASKNQNPDLFWALRGGGGGSFGAVTAFTVATRPAPSVTTFYFDWPWAAAHEVLDAWQHWMTTSDRALTTTCKLLTDPGPGTQTPMIAGTWIASPSALDGQLAPLLAKLPKPATRSVHTHSYASAMLLEAGCSTAPSANACVARALTPSKRQPFAATSAMLAEPLPADAIEAAVTRANQALDVGTMVEGGVSFDSLGGAVADVAGDATAFGHRDAIASMQYTATWRDGGTPAGPFDAYVGDFRAALAPWTGTGAYVNYADATITDYGPAYWGANYARLQEVKTAVDPHNLFHFPQSVAVTVS